MVGDLDYKRKKGNLRIMKKVKKIERVFWKNMVLKVPKGQKRL